MKNYIIKFGLLISAVIVSLNVNADNINLKSVTFGIVPQQAGSKLAKNWAPIIQYLSEKSGTKIIFKTAPDIPTFESRVLNGEYDIAYMNPYHYSVYSIKPGYRALAKQENKSIRGILVAHKSSKLKGIDDLHNHELAFPSPAAFAASMLPRANLSSAGIKFTPKYVGSHDSVYKSVAKGLFIAGGGIERTLNALDENIKKDIEVIWKSDAYTPHAFAYHPDMDKTIIEKLREAMIAMKDDKRGLALLKKIKFDGIVAAKDTDWDDIRFLDSAEVDWLLRKSEK